MLLSKQEKVAGLREVREALFSLREIDKASRGSRGLFHFEEHE